MSPKDEVITIKVKPAGVRHLMRMLYDAGGKEALFDHAHSNDLEAAEDRIGNMELEIAGLQQQVETLKENLAEVTRERDELRATLLGVFRDFNMPENNVAPGDSADKQLVWLRNSVIAEVDRLAKEAIDDDKPTEATTTNDPESEV